MIGRILGPVQAQRFAEPRISACQVDDIDADLLAEHGKADPAIQFEHSNDRIDQIGGGAKLVQLFAKTAGFRARLRAKQIVERGAQAVEARSQPVDDFAGRDILRRASQQVGNMKLKAGRGTFEQAQPDVFFYVAVSSAFQISFIPNSARGDKGGGGFAEGRAFLLGQREGAMMPTGDEAIGDLRRDNLPQQPMIEDGRRCPSCICGGKAPSNSGSSVDR